jgi:hypothetical protein
MSSHIHARVTDRVRSFVVAGLRRVAARIAPPAPPPAPISTATTLGLACNMFAAMAPLPLAPVPTGDGDTDAHNLRLFQTALAEHAKHNERLRTVGALLSIVAR